MAELNPLRRSMIEDMKVRNLSPVTQRCYVHAVAKFAQYFNRSPDRLGLADVRTYQIHLVSSGMSWAGFNVAVCALRSAPDADPSPTRARPRSTWMVRIGRNKPSNTTSLRWDCFKS